MGTEADEQFAARLADELRRRLGTGVDVLGLEVDTSAGRASMRATWAAGGERHVSHGTADNALDAYETLVRAISDRWLRTAFTRLVDD